MRFMKKNKQNFFLPSKNCFTHSVGDYFIRNTKIVNIDDFFVQFERLRIKRFL